MEDNAKISKDCQLRSGSVTDITAINRVEETMNVKQVPDDMRQTGHEENHKTKKKKRKHLRDVIYVKKQKPNYFIGIKVCDKEIVDNCEKVQKHIVNKHKALEGALIALPTLHITLAVMNLNDEDEDMMKRSFEAMEYCLKVCGPSLISTPLTLTFEGLGHFPSGVVFAKVKEGNEITRLTEIARQVHESFDHHGIPIDDERFIPHLTLLKTSKLHGKWKELKPIKRLIREDLYKEYSDLQFGSEDVLSLQLLSMNKGKDEHGYYQCMKSISFKQES